MKNQIHLSTGILFFMVWLSPCKDLSGCWFGESESSWMQKNIDKDSVHLESSKSCLMPILVCNFFHFSNNNLVSEKWTKQGNRQSCLITLQYLVLFYGISISQIRKLKSIRERGQCRTKTKRGFCSGSQGKRFSHISQYVENCHIGLTSGLKNTYPCIFLQILQFSCPRILSVGSMLQRGKTGRLWPYQVVALGIEMM